MSHSSIGSIVLLVCVVTAPCLSQDYLQRRYGNAMESRLNYIQHLHDSIHGNDRLLINGELYFPHQQGATNHPFFEKEGWLEGTIFFGRNEYRNCLMRYDLFLDQLLYLHISEGANTLALNSGIVSGFIISNVKFKHLEPLSSSKGKRMNGGYYQENYNGFVSLYTRWTKHRIKNDGHRKDEFQLKRELFLMKDGNSYLIRNDRQLRNAMEPHSKIIKSYMKQNNIHIITSTPEEVGSVIRFYENLLNNN